ncbi:hypothetical protein EIP91_005800 [Steccherinum ochraceum]|uniref:Yeast cell wall synthesis Kre9/Knh1-like N-terminal domain-containing protein n=1 Tax=Steccherinum ochraceum TaxID=92696 RepID=A0A4R0RLQ7_9APHY|nr:hypothetical protein EIP91_005800 [Steccherinum ochraceum]
MPAMSSSIFLAVALLFTAVHALPLKVTLAARDSVAPPITKPAAGDVWHVGDTVTVTWDTSSLPPKANVTNPQASIILGFLENNSENLMLDSPLAKGVDIFAGSQDITVPDVTPKEDYIVALIGDSGNISPQFQIVAKLVATPSPPISEGPSLVPPPPSSPVPSPTLEPISPIVPSTTPTSTATESPSVAPTSTTPSSSISPPASPLSTSTQTVSPSTTPSAQSAQSDSSDALSSKHVGLSSVVFGVAVALFMI